MSTTRTVESRTATTRTAESRTAENRTSLPETINPPVDEVIEDNPEIIEPTPVESNVFKENFETQKIISNKEPAFPQSQDLYIPPEKTSKVFERSFSGTSGKISDETVQNERLITNRTILHKKSRFEIIGTSKIQVQKSTRGTGEIFNSFPDLKDRWVDSDLKDWNLLKSLLNEKGRRHPLFYFDPQESKRQEIKDRWAIIKELSEEGSDFYLELSNVIDNYDAFEHILKNENFEANPSRYENLSHLDPFQRDLRNILDLVKAVKFVYLEDLRRFGLEITNDKIKEVFLSDQICYVLGYDVGQPIKNGDISKYTYDLRGGVSHICVYINGVTEQIIVGDSLASLLQIVAVSGNPGDVIEKKYDSPLFSKVKSREIDDIEIELRTLEGRLIPFDYGVVIITLIFKKLIVF
jgi:hypothetical protein